MKKGNYIYYRDNRDKYILKINRGTEEDKYTSFQITVVSCTCKEYVNHEYLWSYQAFIRDCKETRILTNAEALAKVL